MTTPNQVRTGLTIVTSAAIAETRIVAGAASTPSDVRAALFAAVPLIVGDYIDGSAALALDWYEELRDEAAPASLFSPKPFTPVDESKLADSIAWATTPLHLIEDLDRITEDLLRQATEDSMRLLDGVVQKDVATGYWDTITANAASDPDAVGWQRFARGGACKFCVMLAGRGSVYTRATANFAAHTTCHCVAGPSFDPDAPRASAMQYVASQKTRTPAQRKALREYLNTNYPDSPG